MENISNWEIFINYLNSNQGLIVFINLLATIFIFGGILFLTKKYANSTEKLANKTSESLGLTRKKEKRDRTLDFLEKFNVERYYKLRRLKFEDFPMKLLDLRTEIEKMEREPSFNAKTNKRHKILINKLNNFDFLEKFPNARFDINYFLNFFDIISIFYNKNNLDKDIFFSKISRLFIDFFLNFSDEIIQITKSPINFEDLYESYNNYLYVIEIIANKPEYSKAKSKLLDTVKNIRNKK